MRTIRIDLAIYATKKAKKELEAYYPGCSIIEGDERKPLYVSSKGIHGAVWIRSVPKVVGTHQMKDNFMRGKIT